MDWPSLLKFGVAGGIGFCVDAAVLYLLVFAGGVSPFVARVFSFLVAVCATWWVNRTFTFRGNRAHPVRQEYLRYLGVQTAGAALNYGVFAATLLLQPQWHAAPVVPLALGSLVAMAFNYAGSRWYVFAPPEVAPHEG